MANIKFISYDGTYPTLCSGKLTVEIDGKVVTFGKVKHYLKSKTLRAGTTELAVEVYVKNDEFSFEEEILRDD